MGVKRVSPTHMRFARLKKKLATTVRGHKLLKNKRDELIRQFLDLVRENKAPREEAEAGIAAANQNSALVHSGMTGEALNITLMAFEQGVCLESKIRNVMNVEISVFEYKTRTSDPNDTYSYGLALTSSGLDDTVESLADLLPDMLCLAECEKPCQFIAVEIEETRRHVNVLEHITIPEAQQNIRYITMKLDEGERSSQTRLMKVKDMMLEGAHHYSEREVVPVVNEVQDRMGRPGHLCNRFTKLL